MWHLNIRLSHLEIAFLFSPHNKTKKGNLHKGKYNSFSIKVLVTHTHTGLKGSIDNSIKLRGRYLKRA